MSTPESDRTFAGSVPDVYEQRFVPLIFVPYARDLGERLGGQSEGSILEIAAGTGVVTRELAATLPDSVSITATDLNPGMLERAMDVGTARPVRWEQADVMSLPFDDAAFDVVVCQFGVMFFQPKAEAFASMRRVLEPGGRLLFNVWESLAVNDFARVAMEGVNTVCVDDPVQFFERTPHGYHDRDTITADLRAGGFTDPPSIEQVGHRSRSDSAEDVAIAFCHGTPLRNELERRGCLAEATAAATTALVATFGTGPIEAGISALVIDVTA